MQKGKIILLNGASSSGKTSIVNELIRILNEPYFILSLDNFLNDNSRLMFKKDSIERSNLILAFYSAIATISNCNVNVIVDQVFDLPEWYVQCKSILKDFSVKYIGVHCSLSILKERELFRQDRKVGLSTQQFNMIHMNKTYDLEIDTTYFSAQECALMLKKNLI